MASAVPHPSRLATLDGIRAIAILLVVFPHIELTGTLPGPAIVQRAVHDLGHGVEVFFVLSGFCLALPLLTELRDRGTATLHLGSFFFNRAFRVIPAYYIAIGVCGLLALFYAVHWHTLPATLSLSKSPWDFAKQFLLLDQSSDPVNSNFWSIPVQLRWYLLFPLLIVLYARSRRAFGLLLAALVLAYNTSRGEAIDIATLPLFMFGIIAADLTVNRHPLRHAGYALVVAGVALGHIADQHLAWTMQPTTFGWQIAAFGFVLAGLNDRRLAAVLSWKPLAALGTISFSIYLLHQPIVEIVAATFKGDSGVLAFVVAIASAALFWRVAERRFGQSAVRRRMRERATPVLDAFFEWLLLPAHVQLRTAHGRAAHQHGGVDAVPADV